MQNGVRKSKERIRYGRIGGGCAWPRDMINHEEHEGFGEDDLNNLCLRGRGQGQGGKGEPEKMPVFVM